MFRRNKTDYKAKLEHKLYLARENPEPTFDLSDCGLRQVPGGIYSLCRVFLKDSLVLDHNKLTSLSAGGLLRDLSGLKILNLQFNSFSLLPEDLSALTSLRELYLNNNNLKQLPKSIGLLTNLNILDVSHNVLRSLPDEIGNLRNLQTLAIYANTNLTHLPQTLCRAKRLIILKLDADTFIYPPANIVANGTKHIMKYICHDNGIDYESPTDLSPETVIKAAIDEADYSNPALEEKIWEFEKLKKQKQQEILKFEKEYESYQRQELELQAALKASRQRFLTDLTEQQTKLESDLAKIQHKKELERCRLIQDLQDDEIKTDLAITNLLISMREPLSLLLEHERLEEEKLLAAATTTRHSDHLRRNDVLEAMRTLLAEETNRFKEYDQNREENARSILLQELMSDSRLSDVLRTQGEQQAELVTQLQMDMELQRMAVGALLERGDARSWSLVQQVHLVELQLAKLTAIEMDRKKLEMDEHLNDLAEKRANLSVLLVDLLDQQGMRRAQLLSTLQNMEKVGHSQEDFWLLQYQQLLDRRSTMLMDVQKNIAPEFAQELLLAGVIQYLPFLAEWVQTADSNDDLTDDQLLEAGVRNCDDRRLIIHAFKQYCMGKYDGQKLTEPSVSTVASAPLATGIEHSTSISSSECVICMDAECAMIFVPCGHMCCCTKCSSSIADCPMCRGSIERRIKVLLP